MVFFLIQCAVVSTLNWSEIDCLSKKYIVLLCGSFESGCSIWINVGNSAKCELCSQSV